MPTKLDYQLADLLSKIIQRMEEHKERPLTDEEIKEFVKKHQNLLNG